MDIINHSETQTKEAIIKEINVMLQELTIEDLNIFIQVISIMNKGIEYSSNEELFEMARKLYTEKAS